MKNSIGLLKIVFDFLSGLKEEDLEALVNKKAQLKLLRPARVQEKKFPDMSIVRQKLDQCGSIDKAINCLTNLRLDRSHLAGLVLAYNLPMSSKDTARALFENIVGYLKQKETLAGLENEDVNPHGYDVEAENGL